MKKSLGLLSIAAFLLMSANARAALITFNSEAAFLAALASSTTFDFEVASDFPLAPSAAIGIVGFVDFDFARTTTGNPVSGTQSMTGDDPPGDFGFATVVFTGLGTLPNAVGFFALDLNGVDSEVVVLDVAQSTPGPGQFRQFKIGLDGADPFTPIYFGVISTDDTIQSITLSGTDEFEADRAWEIDDLTIGNTGRPMPEPATLFLLGAGLLGGAVLRRRTL